MAGDHVTCDAYTANMTSMIRNVERILSETRSLNMTHASSSSPHRLSLLVNDILSPAVCLFGVVGNALNLVVLTRRRLQHSMDGLERSVRLGLVALAVSDAVFCFLYLLATFLLPTRAKYAPGENRATLFFGIYHEGLINVFQVSSTWLTVNMALGRYFAICRPLHARGYINARGTRLTVVLVFLGAAVFNLPRFWHYTAAQTPCDVLLASATHNTTSVLLEQPPGCHCLYHWKTTSGFYNSSVFRLSYGLACTLVEILLPLILLTVCNVCLIRALRRSYRMQTQYRTHQNPVDSAHRITPTLIALIVLFTLLVTPSHVLLFVLVVVAWTTGRSTAGLSTFRTFEAATNVTNFLLLTNFAVNFVLYLVVNADFRRVTRDLVTCRRSGTCGGRQAGAAATSTAVPGVRYWATGNKAGIVLTTDVCNLSDTEAPF